MIVDVQIMGGHGLVWDTGGMASGSCQDVRTILTRRRVDFKLLHLGLLQVSSTCERSTELSEPWLAASLVCTHLQCTVQNTPYATLWH